MSAQEHKYNSRYLGHEDTSRLKSRWDNILIMDWIEYQPNPFEAPEFYEPMAGHDPPQITLSREIREQLGEVWSPGRDFIHPLAHDLFEHEEEKAASKAAFEAAEAVLATLREMGIDDASLAVVDEGSEESEEENDDDDDDESVIESS